MRVHCWLGYGACCIMAWELVDADLEGHPAGTMMRLKNVMKSRRELRFRGPRDLVEYKGIGI
jgi:hypothetical protein